MLKIKGLNVYFKVNKFFQNELTFKLQVGNNQKSPRVMQHRTFAPLNKNIFEHQNLLKQKTLYLTSTVRTQTAFIYLNRHNTMAERLSLHFPLAT